MRFTLNRCAWRLPCIKHALPQCREARSNTHTIYAHIYTHTQIHIRSPIRTLQHLRITLHYADFLPFSLNILPSAVAAVVVFYRPPYLLLLPGLRLEKIFLFNLFMNEMAVGGRIGLAIKAIASAPSRPCWNCWHFQLRVPTALSHR